MASQTPKKGFSPGGQVLLAIFLVVSLACVVVYAREGEEGPLHTSQSFLSSASSPFKAAGASVSGVVDNVGDAVENVTASDETLQGLREQNKQLRSIIAQLEEYRQEAERLDGLLKMKDSYDLDAVGARVIGRTGNSWNQIITIDKGTSDGVEAGLSVMGSHGLVGQVISATATTADVRLLVDQQSGVAAMVQSSREEGIVRGSLEGLLYLENIDSDARVEVDDVIITSGLGGSHAKGLIIGTVSKIEQKQGDVTRTIIIAPNGDTGPMEEVLVVLQASSSNQESSALDE